MWGGGWKVRGRAAENTDQLMPGERCFGYTRVLGLHVLQYAPLVLGIHVETAPLRPRALHDRTRPSRSRVQIRIIPRARLAL